MSADCSSYVNADKVLVGSFSCPREDGEAGAIYCCGFQDVKYCCDDPNSFFPYEHNYMWWLSPIILLTHIQFAIELQFQELFKLLLPNQVVKLEEILQVEERYMEQDWYD
ncbi:protein shisa-like-2A isoform 2-T4 [Liasis olivaceus]